MGSEHPDWLPLDWKVNVRIGSFGRKDKYYIHPPTGLTFNSKPQVLRYLSSPNSSNPKMDIKKTVAEKLPPGWIKEIRTKKKKGKTRRDPYYIDPVSGRQFRSMQEVFRYLKSNDSGKEESKLNDKGHKSTELVDNSQSSSVEAKRQKSIDKKSEKMVADQESIKSGPDAAAPEKVEKHIVGDKHREDDSVVQKLQKKPPRENKQRKSGRRLSMRLNNNKLNDDAKECSLQSGSETAAENNMNIPESKGLENRGKKSSCTVENLQHENPAPPNEKKSTKRKWVNNSPRRTSKRLACLEAEQSVEVKAGKKDGALSRLSSEREVDSTKISSASGQSIEPETAKSCATDADKQQRVEKPTNVEQKESITDAKFSSEEQKSVGVEDLDLSLKDLFMDPCIEFAIKTLTGAIPIEDVTKSEGYPVSSSNQTSGSSNQTSGCSSSGDIWSDPCFEFAVKTLTGEIPAENGLQVHDKPESSSFTQSTAAPRNSYPPFARR